MEIDCEMMAQKLFEYIETRRRPKALHFEIADEIGIDKSLYSRWRTGEVGLSVAALVRIRRLFGISPERLHELLDQDYPAERVAKHFGNYSIASKREREELAA